VQLVVCRCKQVAKAGPLQYACSIAFGKPNYEHFRHFRAAALIAFD
jgi:hypothetical protein